MAVAGDDYVQRWSSSNLSRGAVALQYLKAPYRAGVRNTGKQKVFSPWPSSELERPKLPPFDPFAEVDEEARSALAELRLIVPLGYVHPTVEHAIVGKLNHTGSFDSAFASS